MLYVCITAPALLPSWGVRSTNLPVCRVGIVLLCDFRRLPGTCNQAMRGTNCKVLLSELRTTEALCMPPFRRVRRQSAAWLVMGALACIVLGHDELPCFLCARLDDVFSVMRAITTYLANTQYCLSTTRNSAGFLVLHVSFIYVRLA